MTTFARGALCALAWSACMVGTMGTVGAQQAPPVFKAVVGLFEINVVVTGEDGRVIADLGADEFNVTIAGKPVPVRLVDFVSFRGKDIGEEQSSATNIGSDGTGLSRGGRVIVLVVDDLSARHGELKPLLLSAERMVTELGRDDLVGLTTTSGLGPVVGPTRDRARVLAALQDRRLIAAPSETGGPFFVTTKEAVDAFRRAPGWTGFIPRECPKDFADSGCPDRARAFATGLGQQIVHRTRSQIDAFRAVIAALGSAPEPRVAVVLSGGLALESVGRWEELERLEHLASELRVQWFVLNGEPEATQLRDSGTVAGVANEFTHRGARSRDGAYLFGELQTLSRSLGGVAYRVVGQADRFFSRVWSETSGIYRLGVELPSWPPNASTLPLRVSVTRRGLVTRTGRHAVLPAEPRIANPRQALMERLAQGGVSFGVPITLGVAARSSPDVPGGRQLLVEAALGAGLPAPVLAGFAILDADGRVAQSGIQTVSAGQQTDQPRLVFPLAVGPGAYRLRFAATDANGSVGSVDHTVSPGLAQLGRMSVSDILVTWTRPGQAPRPLVLESIPREAASVSAAVEVYLGGNQQEASVPNIRFQLLTLDGAEVGVGGDVGAVASGDRFVARFEVALASLPQGTYRLRASLAGTDAPSEFLEALLRKQ